MWLAIDPGIKSGWCVLDSTGHVSVVGKGEEFPTLSNKGAIIECPQVYPRQKKKVDPNNLITLAVRVGRYQQKLISAGVPCKLVLPTTWKGQIDKFSHHAHTWGKMTADERATVVRVAGEPSTSKSYSEDVWDAVALAKWAFGASAFGLQSLKT